MTEYAFKVESLERKPSIGDLKDVVVVIHYRMLAKDGEYSADGYGAIQIGEPDAAAFTAFDDVTVEECKGWAFSTLAVNQNNGAEEDAEEVTAADVEAAMKAALDTNIANQKNPPVISGLPTSWAAE